MVTLTAKAIYTRLFWCNRVQYVHVVFEGTRHGGHPVWFADPSTIRYPWRIVAPPPPTMAMQAAFHDLYWSLGDAGPQEDPFNHALRLDTLFGSIIRISVPSDGTGYEIPSGNYPGGGYSSNR